MARCATEDMHQLAQFDDHLRMRPEQVDRGLEGRLVRNDPIREVGGEHPHEALLDVAHRINVGTAGAVQQRSVPVKTLAVVDMLHARDPAPQGLFVRPRGRHPQTGGLAQRRPAAVAGVNVGNFEARVDEIIGHGDRFPASRQRPQFLDLGRPARRDGLADAAKNDVPRHPVELHVAAGRQEREAVGDSTLEVAAAAAEERAVTLVEPELATVHADEVEHRTQRLVFGDPQATAQLLQKQRGALGGAQHQDGVDARHVDALVEQVDREDDLDSSFPQVPDCGSAIRVRRLPPDRHGGDAELLEPRGHEAGVGDADAES